MAKKFKKSTIGSSARIAAERFLKVLKPSLNLWYPDDLDRQIITCAEGAFALYEIAWDCHDHSILDWQWPFLQLQEGGQFQGNEPWTVLLRHAVALCRTNAPAK